MYNLLSFDVSTLIRFPTFNRMLKERNLLDFQNCYCSRLRNEWKADTNKCHLSTVNHFMQAFSWYIGSYAHMVCIQVGTAKNPNKYRGCCLQMHSALSRMHDHYTCLDGLLYKAWIRNKQGISSPVCTLKLPSFYFMTFENKNMDFWKQRHLVFLPMEAQHVWLKLSGRWPIF